MSTSPDENPTGSAGHCVAPVQPHVQAIRTPSRPAAGIRPAGEQRTPAGHGRIRSVYTSSTPHTTLLPTGIHSYAHASGRNGPWRIHRDETTPRGKERTA